MNTVYAPNRLILAPADAAAMQADDAQEANAIAKVNGKPIPQSRLEYLMKSKSLQGHSDASESMNHALHMLISQEVLYQEAARMGYEMNADVATQIEISKEEVVIDAYLRDYAKSHPISEDMVKQEYEYQKALSGDKEYKVQHILFEAEEEATLAVAELKKGASFEELAAQNSADEGSNNRGGVLDWAPAVRYVPQLQEALKKLEKGQMTEAPVQSEYGWHVVRLDDERQLTFPAFEDVKLKIYENLQRQAVDEIIAALRAKAEIE
jgi:peptidyl-prolyl cis-trans isomerase C